MSQHRSVTCPSGAPVAARLARIALIAALTASLLAPSSAVAVTRDEALERGAVWVRKAVPYSQSAWADESGRKVSNSSQGYRTDCSGFVSMCWRLTWDDGRPRSLDTALLAKSWATERIGKDDLQPGDVLLKPKTSRESGHVALFVGWVDPITKTQYVSMEESGSRDCAVSRIVDYPFYNDSEGSRQDYFPHRYLGMEEDYDEQIESVRGYDRYETAVAASRSSFATGSVETVVVASGGDWPDALGGAALAGAWDSPVLLVKPDSVPSAVRSEIARLGASKAVLLGGPAAVGEKVRQSLSTIGGGLRVTRLGGRDRYETAAKAAAEALQVAGARGKKPDGTVFVASGATFPDALAASPASAAGVRPIVLARPRSVPSTTANALEALAPGAVVLLGSEAALGDQVAVGVCELLAGAGNSAGVTRVGGRDRYETASAVAAWSAARGLAWKGCGLATGTGFPDALSGGAALGERGSVMLLTRREPLSGPTGSALRKHAAAVERAVCFGGTSAVASSTRREVAVILGMNE